MNKIDKLKVEEVYCSSGEEFNEEFKEMCEIVQKNIIDVLPPILGINDFLLSVNALGNVFLNLFLNAKIKDEECFSDIFYAILKMIKKSYEEEMQKENSWDFSIKDLSV